MDDGLSAFAFAIILAAACLYMEWCDKRRGRYPRDWDE